jgi:hypothetical protein
LRKDSALACVFEFENFDYRRSFSFTNPPYSLFVDDSFDPLAMLAIEWDSVIRSHTFKEPSREVDTDIPIPGTFTPSLHISGNISSLHFFQSFQHSLLAAESDHNLRDTKEK